MTKSLQIWFQTVLLIIPFAVFGQKVKYKDIFPLLSTKQYEQAEPFLRRYLKENDDNPNAYLFMGLIFQEKSGKTDILKQTSASVSYSDSAVLFYDKTLQMITEKEIRRNKEYYQSYNRRDLRTGEFGVKVSDVQFDIEKRKEGLIERKEKVKMIKHYFALADTLYKKCNARYAEIHSNYQTARELYLRSDSSVVAQLKVLGEQYDSAVKAFDLYKSTLSTLGSRTSYSQSLLVSNIDSYEKDGLDPANFYGEEVEVWNYKKFAEQSLSTIQREIFPMRKHLVNYDIEINKLRNKLATDSVSVINDLTKIIDRLLYEQLQKFDPLPLPMAVFSLKTADLEYRSKTLEHFWLKDSSNVQLQIQLVEDELKLLAKLDSIAQAISSMDIEAKSKDYLSFVTETFGAPSALKSFCNGVKEFAGREQREKSQLLEIRRNALNWIIDGTDSIPLANTLSTRYYKPLLTLPEKYTIGIQIKDSVPSNGYFYTLTSARKPDVKVLFPIDKMSFKEKNLPLIRSISFADPGGQIFFIMVYSETAVREKFPATLAKIYRSDGLAWSNNFQLAFIPKTIQLKPETGEVYIKSDLEEIILDKNGKLLK